MIANWRSASRHQRRRYQQIKLDRSLQLSKPLHQASGNCTLVHVAERTTSTRTATSRTSVRNFQLQAPTCDLLHHQLQQACHRALQPTPRLAAGNCTLDPVEGHTTSTRAATRATCRTHHRLSPLSGQPLSRRHILAARSVGLRTAQAAQRAAGTRSTRGHGEGRTTSTRTATRATCSRIVSRGCRQRVSYAPGVQVQRCRYSMDIAGMKQMRGVFVLLKCGICGRFHG